MFWRGRSRGTRLRLGDYARAHWKDFVRRAASRNCLHPRPPVAAFLHPHLRRKEQTDRNREDVEAVFSLNQNRLSLLTAQCRTLLYEASVIRQSRFVNRLWNVIWALIFLDKSERKFASTFFTREREIESKVSEVEIKNLRDAFNRPMKDLRISGTDRCNFRCTYCMPFDEYTYYLVLSLQRHSIPSR